MRKMTRKMNKGSNGGRSRSWVISVFALVFALILALALTACGVVSASEPTATDPTISVDQSDAKLDKLKEALSIVLSPEKLPHLMLAVVVVLAIVGLIKKMWWMCITAAMIAAILFLAQSPMIDNAVEAIKRFVNDTIDPLGKGDYVGDIITAARRCIKL